MANSKLKPVKIQNNLLSEYYNQPMQVKYPWWSYFLDNIIKNTTREEIAASFDYKGRNCLDLACGDGELLNKYLFKKYDFLKGVDISGNEIKRAMKNKKSNVDFIISDINIFLDDEIRKKEKYNDVYILAFLEHSMWPVEIISKVLKIIEKNGKVIVEVPNVAWLPYRIGFLFGKFPETAPTYGVIPGVHDEHIRFFTLETLDKMFMKAGFQRLDIKCSGRLKLFKSIWPGLLASDFIIAYKKR